MAATVAGGPDEGSSSEDTDDMTFYLRHFKFECQEKKNFSIIQTPRDKKPEISSEVCACACVPVCVCVCLCARARVCQCQCTCSCARVWVCAPVCELGVRVRFRLSFAAFDLNRSLPAPSHAQPTPPDEFWAFGDRYEAAAEAYAAWKRAQEPEFTYTYSYEERKSTVCLPTMLVGWLAGWLAGWLVGWLV